eukprot:294006-Rhodomonas_salina.3
MLPVPELQCKATTVRASESRYRATLSQKMSTSLSMGGWRSLTGMRVTCHHVRCQMSGTHIGHPNVHARCTVLTRVTSYATSVPGSVARP